MKKEICLILSLLIFINGAAAAKMSGNTALCYDFDSVTVTVDPTSRINNRYYVNGRIDEFNIGVHHYEMLEENQVEYCAGSYGAYGKSKNDGALRVMYRQTTATAEQNPWTQSSFLSDINVDIKKGEKLWFSGEIAAADKVGDITVKLVGTAENGSRFTPRFKQVYPEPYSAAEKEWQTGCDTVICKLGGWYYFVWNLGGPQFEGKRWYRVDTVIDTENEDYGGVQTLSYYLDGELIRTGILDADSGTDKTELIKKISGMEIVTAPSSVMNDEGKYYGQHAELYVDNITVNVIGNGAKTPEYLVDGKKSAGGYSSGSVISVKSKDSILFAEEKNENGADYHAKKSDASGNISIVPGLANGIKLFLWGNSMEPRGIPVSLVPYNEKKVLEYDFESMDGLTFVNSDKHNELFTYEMSCGKFGRTSDNGALHVFNTDKPVIAGQNTAEYEQGIDLTPHLQTSGDESITVSFDFAQDELNIPKSFKAKSNRGLTVNMADFFPDGRVFIFGIPCKNLRIDKEQWYHFDIVINSRNEDTVNTCTAYVNGKKYFENVPFAAGAKIENKITGFEYLKLTYSPWDYYKKLPDGHWYAEPGDEVNFMQDGFYLDNFTVITSEKCSPQFADFDVRSKDAVLNLTVNNDYFIISDYGQPAEDMANSLKNEFVLNARFTDENGEKLQELSGTGEGYLRLTTADNYDIYYKLKAGTDEAVGEQLGIEGNANPDTSDWYEYEFPDINVLTKDGNILNTHAVTAGEDIEAHGRILAEGEYFVGENDGKKINFWGTNVIGQGCFPEHAEAEKRADMIAQQGFNIVRFHQICGREGNIFGGLNNGYSLSAAQMDKMCYFMKQLRDRGIYYYIDLGFDIYSGDDGNASVNPLLTCYFDDKTKKLQVDYARDLLTYADPYDGGGRICDNPALATAACINEANLFRDDVCSLADSNDKYKPYYDELENLWNEFLKNKYSSSSERLTYKVKNLKSGESISSENVRLGTYSEWDNFTDARVQDIFIFLNSLHENYFAEIKKMMTDNNVETLLTGTTIFGMREPQIMKSNLSTDFVDIHYYWCHPDGFSLDEGVKLSLSGTETGSMLKDKQLGIIGRLANRKPYEKPYVISEWNACASSIYMAEGALLMSAYSKFQNWNPMQFMFSAKGMQNYTNTRISDVFSTENHPIRIGTMPAASMLHRNVSEAEDACFADYSGAEWYDYNKHILKKSDGSTYHMWKNYDMFDMDCRNGFLHKTGISLLKKPENSTERINEEDTAEVFVSDTGELVYNQKEYYFTVNTDKSKAAAAFFGGKELEVGNAVFKINNEFAAVYLNSVDGKDTENSGRMLLTVAGKAVSSGQVLSRDGAKVVKRGTTPVLVEPIEGYVKIKTNENLTVYPLTSSGERLCKIPTTYDDGVLTVPLSAKDKTMNYEIVK